MLIGGGELVLCTNPLNGIASSRFCRYLGSIGGSLKLEYLFVTIGGSLKLEYLFVTVGGSLKLEYLFVTIGRLLKLENCLLQSIQ